MPFNYFWRAAFRASAAKIDDDVLNSQIEMYRDRAWVYQVVSYLLLIVTAVVIISGIVVFTIGDSGDDLLAEDEVKLESQIKEKQAEINALGTEEAHAEQRVAMLTRALTLSSVLASAKTGAIGFKDEPGVALRDSLSKTLRASMAIVDAVLLDPIPDKVDIVISDISLGERNSFSKESVRVIRNAATHSSIGIDFTGLRLEFQRLADELKSLQEVRLEDDSLVYSEQDMREYVRVVDNMSQIYKLESLYTQVSREADKAAETHQDLAGHKAQTEARKQLLEQEKNVLQRKLTEVRQQREKILFMAWVPNLTMRVGIVVLLLFMTKVLLASYRYTIGVSAFYLARSDAIQLLQPIDDNDKGYSIEELVVLVELLTPTSQVDSVTDPTDNLTEILKAYISKRG